MENFLKSKVLQKKSLEMFLKTMRIIKTIKLDAEQDLNLPFNFQYVSPIFLVKPMSNYFHFTFHYFEKATLEEVIENVQVDESISSSVYKLRILVCTAQLLLCLTCI